MLVLSISQNFIWNSSPAAKKRFLVVSNCTTPNERFLKPENVLLIAPSLSFHSTRWDSPSLLVPQEKSLKEGGKVKNDYKKSNANKFLLFQRSFSKKCLVSDIYHKILKAFLLFIFLPSISIIHSFTIAVICSIMTPLSIKLTLASPPPMASSFALGVHIT